MTDTSIRVKIIGTLRTYAHVLTADEEVIAATISNPDLVEAPLPDHLMETVADSIEQLISEAVIQARLEEIDSRHLLDLGGKMINEDQLLINLLYLDKRKRELRGESREGSDK